MANLKNVVYLTNEQYTTLITNGSVTVGDQTVTYDPNDLYLTPLQTGNYLKTYNASDFSNWAECWAQAKIDGVILVKGRASYINNNAYNSFVFNSAGTRHGHILFTDINSGAFQFRYVYSDDIANTGATAKSTVYIPLSHQAWTDKDKVWTAEYGVHDGSWAFPTLNGKEVPAIPDDADTKTYNLKLVNGTLTWVAE